MGTIQHHTVIATTWYDDYFVEVKRWVMHLDGAHQKLFIFQTHSLSNGYLTVVLTPDGSKEGWASSDEGDGLRDRFLAKLREFDYGDGSNPWTVVEVSFGELGAYVVRTLNINEEELTPPVGRSPVRPSSPRYVNQEMT